MIVALFSSLNLQRRETVAIVAINASASVMKAGTWIISRVPEETYALIQVIVKEIVIALIPALQSLTFK